MKKAFSLIELLISLIVISLIIATFTPMLSTRLKHREIAYSSVKQMKIDCSKFDSGGGQCLLCDENKCNLCTSSINVPDGYFVNPNQTCSRQSCTSFDSNCKRCTKDGCFECKSGWVLGSDKRCSQTRCNKGYYVSGSSCFECPDGQYQPNDNSTAASCINCSNLHSNCSHCNKQTGCCLNCTDGYNTNSCGCTIATITCASPCKTCSGSSTNCTSCYSENGYVLTNGKCEKPSCAGIIVNMNGGKYCFTKKNLGDDNTTEVQKAYNDAVSAEASSDYKIYTATSSSAKCAAGSSHPCCWSHGSTANNSASAGNKFNGIDNYSNFNYSGQGRTVCDWYAAQRLCAKLKANTGQDWHTPTKSERTALDAVITSETATCSNSSVANQIQKCAGPSGLQLCGNDSPTYGSPQCQDAAKCSGASSNLCRPRYIWGGEEKFSMHLAQGKLPLSGLSGTSSYLYGHSVRCVYKMN